MLRFCGENLIKQSENLNVDIAEQYFVFSERIWQKGRDYFKHNGFHDVTKLQLIPVWDAQGTRICYGWQDIEANRELRMLKELGENRIALQFGDVFPQIREVVVCGCNELAYHFVQYLEKLHIPVSVKGKYWEYLGYKSIVNIDFDDGNKMIIQTEHILENKKDLFQRMIRSASPDFECIDKVYEANILKGTIKNIEGDLEWLFTKLKGKDVIIEGTDDRAQDTYDLIYSWGIDIKCFVSSYDVYKVEPSLLMGKRVLTIAEILDADTDAVFIEPYSKNSVWGNVYVELLDYYGYERNKNLFLISDYTDIPCSNLIHILKGKSVFLTGDQRLCEMLMQYLAEVEEGDIKLQYAKVLQKEMLTEQDVVCMVNIWYGQNTLERKEQVLDELPDFAVYTDYFSRVTVFVNIDQYRTRYTGAYHVKQIIPKGILLNDTYGYSGNIFLHGLLDGHPDILLLQYDTFSNNLFVYCIRLSIEKVENILNAFQLMLKEEMNESEFQEVFPFWNRFERSMKRWLSLEKKFTSEELFVIFHIAYTEMMSGEEITDVSRKVIYFDPHWVDPRERPVLAKWLESQVLNEKIITLCRDNTVWLCSLLNFVKNEMKYEDLMLAHVMVYNMLQNNMDIGIEKATFQHCENFKVRFEDLKLHPREELLKICNQIGIPWSDSMLHTTAWGKLSSMGAVRDFDLKPVFNKHEADWSEFDRFRLCIISSPYQKRYGYSYEDCSKFSRAELWEMFLKEFQFLQGLQFASAKEEAAYYLWAYESIRWKLWENRKHLIMDDIKIEFEPIEIGKTKKELKLENQQIIKEERERLVKMVKCKEKLVLYGLGKDGAVLWDCLNESVYSRLVLCDKKADNETYHFCGKQVVRPEELCNRYRDYEILVTSSRFYREIKAELLHMGVESERIICNTIQLWEEDE